MNKAKVRCWEVKNYQPSLKKVDVVYVTYLDGFGGYDLITCLACGTVYAVDVTKELYSGCRLDNKLENISCECCGNNLKSNYSYYPDKYYKDGKIYNFKKPELLPLDEDSIIKEFYGIYEE